MNDAKEGTELQGIVLYDGACGFCRQWVPFWGKTLRRAGFEIGALQDPDSVRRLQLANEKLTQDLRLLLNDGTQIVGADVYRYAMRRIWWAFPIYFLSTLPMLRSLFNWTYRTFANNRYRISTKCGLRNRGG